ncbi:hypothetical protein QD712_25665 [Streptomyces acidiscabies]|uniref:hypothetical protein n=1 Tax=Streptomyces acidiscabies TaxID=42234 RepID=UPI0030CA7045
MIAEAVDTMLTLGWALAAWIVILATITTLLLLSVAAVIAVTVQGIRRLASRARTT